MRFIAKRLLSTMFSAGIFVLIAASASAPRPSVPPRPRTSVPVSTFAGQHALERAGGASGAHVAP